MVKMILFSHPTLNENAKALINGLLKNKILYELYTTVAVFEGQLLYRLGGYPKLKDLKRRNLDKNWQAYTKAKPFFEFGRLLASKLHLEFLVTHEKGFFCIDKVYHEHDKWVSTNLLRGQKDGLIGVYAYEDGAKYSFINAKKQGVKCFYDLPTGYWRASRKLLQAEIEKRKEWANTFTGFNDSIKKLESKEIEITLADVIFVASQFTANTLKFYPGKLPPVKIIPYGFPSVFKTREYNGFNSHRRIKVLFVGKLTQQKGIANLFEAVIGLENHIQLTIVGHKPVENLMLNTELRKHTYIESLPHDKILELMREQDLLVFPTLFDGFGLVITEAMSQGTPVIATERCAGPDLIVHGENGWIVKAGSTVSLKNQLMEIIKNPNCIKNAGKAAMMTAQDRPWEVYGQELAESIRNIK